jgi:hypothetical protein
MNDSRKTNDCPATRTESMKPISMRDSSWFKRAFLGAAFLENPGSPQGIWFVRIRSDSDWFQGEISHVAMTSQFFPQEFGNNESYYVCYIAMLQYQQGKQYLPPTSMKVTTILPKQLI